MLTKSDVTGKVSFYKNMITDQTFRYLNVRQNSAGVAFDVTEGLGEAASNTSVVVALIGGFADVRVYGDFKYVSPTSQANSDLGLFGRFTNPDHSGYGNGSYYYARVDGGVAKLAKINVGTFTTLSSTNWALAQGDVATITLVCRGSAISATFYNAGLGTVTLAATDTSIPEAGCAGFRSASSSLRCRNLGVDQL